MERRLLVRTVFAALSAAPVLAHGGRYCVFPGAPPPLPNRVAWHGWWDCNKHRFAAPSKAERISGAMLHQVVLPRIGHAVRTTDDPRFLATCLRTVAWVGRGHRSTAAAAFLRGYVGHESPEVRSSAVLALGILGEAESTGLLSQIAANSLRARELLDPDRFRPIPAPLRASACRALGLIAHDPGASFTTRADACRSLSETLRGSMELELTIAALQGLSLIRVDATSPDPAERTLLRTVLRAMTRHLDRRLPKGTEDSRARVPLAVARVLGRGDSGHHRYFKRRWLAALTAPGDRSAQRATAALALGRLAGPTGADREYSDALRHAARHAPPSVRCHAILGIGHIGGTENRAFLVQLLGRPDATGEPACAALALGLTCRDWETGSAVLARLRSTRSADTRRATAVALSLIDPGRARAVLDDGNEAPPIQRQLRGALAVVATPEHTREPSPGGIALVVDSICDHRLSLAVRSNRASTLAGLGHDRGLPWVARLTRDPAFHPGLPAWRRWDTGPIGDGRTAPGRPGPPPGWLGARGPGPVPQGGPLTPGPTAPTGPR